VHFSTIYSQGIDASIYNNRTFVLTLVGEVFP